jgi:hypothetical protein
MLFLMNTLLASLQIKIVAAYFLEAACTKARDHGEPSRAVKSAGAAKRNKVGHRLFMSEARTLDGRHAVAPPQGAPGRGYF